MIRVRRDKNSERKIWLLIFVAVSIFCIIFFSARGRFEPAFSSPAVTSALAPFQRAVAWAGSQVNYVTSSIWEVVTVYHQNEMLKNEVVQLRQQNLQANEYAAENARLKELLNYKQYALQFDLTAARVIGRDAATWTSVLIINRGSEDGIAKNMPVITEKGLVGLVTEVSSNASKVQLILDPRTSVGALVQRTESRVAGILKGNLTDDTTPSMVNIPINSDIVEGDIIISSGFGGIYPKGLMLGTVKKLEDDGGGLLEVAYIEPAVDFQKLEDVMVITASREAPPQAIVPPAQTPGTETDASGSPIGR